MDFTIDLLRVDLKESKSLIEELENIPVRTLGDEQQLHMLRDLYYTKVGYLNQMLGRSTELRAAGLDEEANNVKLSDVF